jgi:hypothetical protein
MTTLNENENENKVNLVAQEYIERLIIDIKKKMTKCCNLSYKYEYDINFSLNDNLKKILQTKFGNDYKVYFKEFVNGNYTRIYIEINFDNDNNNDNDNDNDNPTNIAFNFILKKLLQNVEKYSKDGHFNCEVEFPNLIPTECHKDIREQLFKKGVTICKFEERQKSKSIITLDWTQSRDNITHKSKEEDDMKRMSNSVIKFIKNDNEENTTKEEDDMSNSVIKTIDSKKEFTRDIFKKIIDNKQFDELLNYTKFDLNYNNYGIIYLLDNCKDENILKHVIDNANNLEFEINGNCKPIHLICQYSTPEMIKYIIDKGVDLECEDFNKMRPIHYICRYSTYDAIIYIINRCVNIFDNLILEKIVKENKKLSDDEKDKICEYITFKLLSQKYKNI